MAEFTDSTVARNGNGGHLMAPRSLPDAALDPLRRSVARLARGLSPDADLRESIRIAADLPIMDVHASGSWPVAA